MQLSFGQALGRLIRQKRQAQGLTQMQLAEDAFGKSGKTRRISELESGTVANPHPKTIDPIIVALGITEQEIEACAKQATARQEDDLDRAYREARNLIEAIARQFEHDNPSASLAEVDRFLRAKATEWAALRARIETIDIDEKALGDIKRKAASALAEGKLDEVDSLLAKAEEEYQRNRTLIEVRRHAEIRISRGDSSLLKGDADAALNHYLTAAEFYRPFDESEMVRTINDIAHKVYEVSRRSLKPIFFVSAALLELLITLPSIKSDSTALTEANYQISLNYRSEYDEPSSSRRDEALLKAIHFSTLAMEAAETQTNITKILSTTIALANCLGHRAEETDSVSDLHKGIELLTSARDRHGNSEAAGHLMSYLQNSLGNLYRNIERLGNEKTVISDAREKALDAFTQAVRASERYCILDTWGASHHNIGLILMQQAREDGIELEERYFFRLRAIVEFNAAIESFSASTFPFHFANAQSRLGELLFEHAAEHPIQKDMESYLLRAIGAFEVAANVLGVERNPDEWASIRANLGSMFVFHSEQAEASIALDDLQRAIESFEESASILEEHGYTSQASLLREKESDARSRRDNLLKTTDEG